MHLEIKCSTVCGLLTMNCLTEPCARRRAVLGPATNLGMPGTKTVACLSAQVCERLALKHHVVLIINNACQG